MKKSLYVAALASIVGLSACQKDDLTAINPDAQNGTLTFLMHTPAGADSLYTITEETADASVVTFTNEKPDYGYQSAVTYSMQVSLEQDFSELKELLGTAQIESMSVHGEELTKAINQLHKLGEYAPITEPQEVYFRLKATVSDATNSPLDPTPVVKPSFSNGVKLMVQTYEMVLNPAAPATYYLIGVDGKWGSVIGTDLIPMSMVAGTEYDEKTGKGEFVYTGFFKAGEGFKIVGVPGQWDEQWGSADGSYVNLVHNDGGSQNITIVTEGFYQVKLNSVLNKLSIQPLEDVEAPVFASIKMIGEYNSWDDTNSEAMVAHSTYNMYTLTQEFELVADGGLKFRADGAWDLSWGGKTFPFCTIPSGDNIPAKAGKYRVVFNVLDACYLFFEITE